MKIYLNQSPQFQLIDIKNLPFVTFERWNFCDSYGQNRSNFVGIKIVCILLQFLGNVFQRAVSALFLDTECHSSSIGLPFELLVSLVSI